MTRLTPTPRVNHEEWALAADEAKEAAASVGKMAGHAVSAVGEMASRAASDVGRKADDLTASAGVGIQELGDRLGQNVPHAGYVGSASQAVVRTVKEGGEYLEGAKLSGITEDVARVIRRNPIPAILIAIGLGWFVGRTLKR
jgi:hypothetical protein